MKKLVLLFLLSSVLMSCKDQTVTSITLNGVTLTGEGPYLEGPNSFQAKISNALMDNDINPKSVDKIELTSAFIILPDSMEEGLIQDFSLLLVSSNSNMKKVAYINPLPSGESEVKLTVAQEQDKIEQLFLKEEFITLLDANFSKDFDSNLEFKANLTFNITTH